jgi:asparagine synthase (glutamine-hydrolysing)
MSGIVASYGPIDSDIPSCMLDRLAHRGRGGAASGIVGDAWLGQRVMPGEPPKLRGARNLRMAADGELYGIEDEGPIAPPGLDLALRWFMLKGPEGLAELDGVFALAIAGEDGRFIAARDPLGVKPLYWARRGGTALFASELGAFDNDWLPDVGWFPPGHIWTPERGLERFAHAVPPELETSPSPEGASPERARERVREALIESVEAQMRGDGEIGAFLSGGLDSSLVSAIAVQVARDRGQTLKTFAVGAEGAPDLDAAREVAAHLGTEHVELTYSDAEALERLPGVVRGLENFDPSLVRSAVANDIVAELAARHVDVVLCGEGADEIFGGYAYLARFDDGDALQAELIRGLEQGHGSGFQRVDRTTTRHGLVARMPFLSKAMIATALAIPAGWKLTSDGEVEKRLLREAFTGWLPDDVLWRKKAQFGDGSGAVDALQAAVAETVSDAEFTRERDRVEPPLRTREEVAYYRIFRESLADARPEEVLGRFVTT